MIGDNEHRHRGALGGCAQVASLRSNLLIAFPGQAGQFGVSVGTAVQALITADGDAIKTAVRGIADVAAEQGWGGSAQVVQKMSFWVAQRW